MNNNRKLIAIGEALIDFIPNRSGCSIKEVESFVPNVGGAPANVCGAFSVLGGKSKLLTQVGFDGFGDKIIEELLAYKIDTSGIARTDKANTSLAFVALKDDGNREFSFYRKPGADMLYSSEDVDKNDFSDDDVLHFCSVSLGNFPMRLAHNTAIEYAKAKNMIISFDPNIRLPLWEDTKLLKKRVREYIGVADVLKISDEELEFITGKTDINEAAKEIFGYGVKVILYTCGSNGAYGITENINVFSDSIKVDAVDTTGAGDGFIGTFLYNLVKNNITKSELKNISEEMLKEMLDYSNKFCSESVKGHGAISSYRKI